MAPETSSADAGSRCAPLVIGQLERWLWLVLELQPTQTDVNIVLSASFGRGLLKVLGGKVECGLSAVELHLDVQNGAIPLEGRWPEHLLQRKTRVKRTRMHEHGDIHTASIGVDSGVGETGLTAKLATGYAENVCNKDSIEDEFEFDVQCVTHSGSPSCLVWRFEVPRVTII
jgi:hypothetical protein